jgi:hypothetical protein
VVTLAASEVATTLPGIFLAILILTRTLGENEQLPPQNGRPLQLPQTQMVL